MNYILKQYSYKNGDSGSGFMTPVEVEILSNPYGRQNPYSPNKKDTTVTTISEAYQSLQPYYFCGVIKRQSLPQNINIRLANYDESPLNADSKSQFIKSIRVPAGVVTSTYFVEFVFKPIANFDSIVFESADGIPAIVGCTDIAKLNNIVNNKNYLNAEGSLIRFSIQSVPGFLMEINGEEIRIPHNGIYEIKNGIILVSSFAPVVCCEETDSYRAQKAANKPICMVNDSMNNRNFRSFTVDYLYYKPED